MNATIKRTLSTLISHMNVKVEGATLTDREVATILAKLPALLADYSKSSDARPVTTPEQAVILSTIDDMFADKGGHYLSDGETRRPLAFAEVVTAVRMGTPRDKRASEEATGDLVRAAIGTSKSTYRQSRGSKGATAAKKSDGNIVLRTAEEGSDVAEETEEETSDVASPSNAPVSHVSAAPSVKKTSAKDKGNAVRLASK